MDKEELETRFVYHAPTSDAKDRHEYIREQAGAFAEAVLEATPESREQSLAITMIEQAMFWANAAIARRLEED